MSTSSSKSSKNGNGTITLSDLLGMTRTVTVDWLGNQVKAVYRPGVLNSSHYEQLREDQDLPIATWDVHYAVRVLAAIPSITEDDGSPFKITEENMGRLPTQLLNRIIGAIGDDLTATAQPTEAEA